MSSILDNELVQKYFSCGCETAGCLHPHEAILRSMEEPIRKGERYLYLENVKVLGVFEQSMDEAEQIVPAFHPFYLRLPERWQPAEKKECDYFSPIGGCPHCHERMRLMQVPTEPPPAPEKCKCCPCHHDTDCPNYQPKFNPLHQGPHTRPETDPVEVVVQELLKMANPIKPTGNYVPSWFEKKLRELVALARKSHV